MNAEELKTLVLRAAFTLGEARLVHEEAKSDPSRNVGTGQKLYQAEIHFDALLRDAITKHRNAFESSLEKGNDR